MNKLKNLIRLAINEPAYALFSLYEKVFRYKLFKRLSLFITYKCNLRCKMCCIWKIDKSNNKINEELSITKLKQIIDEVECFHPKILLTGGEPLLREEWITLAEYIKQKNLRCYLQTNGVMIKEFKDAIMNYIDFLNVSIDGPKEVHNKIRGDDSFDEIIGGLTIIDSLKKKKGVKKPYINICYTITFWNYQNLNEIVSFFTHSDININELNFQHFEYLNDDILQKYKKIYVTHGFNNPEIWDSVKEEVNEIDTNYLSDSINRIKRYNSRFRINFYPNFNEQQLNEYYTNPISISKKYFRDCKSVFHEFAIYPNGDVWSCPSRIIGNVKKDNLPSILNKIKSNIAYGFNQAKLCEECAGELYIYYVNLFYLLGKNALN